jgi:hypothetical protein
MEPNANLNGDDKSVGPVIALIVILAIIVLGGLYFWGQRADNGTTDIYGNPISTSTDTSAIESQSDSDETASIEADLNSTNYDIDSELNAS